LSRPNKDVLCSQPDYRDHVLVVRGADARFL
jgi:hypothetical protein